MNDGVALKECVHNAAEQKLHEAQCGQRVRAPAAVVDRIVRWRHDAAPD